MYLVDGLHRYRLFFKTAFQVDPGKEYIAEGVNAQKAIDEIGDPDQGKNGYPLQSSCDRVVRTAWPELAFDVTDSHATPCAPGETLSRQARISGDAATARYLQGERRRLNLRKTPRLRSIPEVSVAADKQRALLIEGPTVLTAPLWEPAGDTVRCKVVIDQEGKISELEPARNSVRACRGLSFVISPRSRVATPSK